MSEARNTITREQLYEQVWKVPIVKTAIALGYSYPELVKICADLNIPRPTGGYWYRLQQGGTTEEVPLPPAPEGAPMEIPLGPRLNAPLPPEPPDYVGVPEERTAVSNNLRKVARAKPSVRSDVAMPATSETSSQPQTKAKPVTVSTPARVAPKFLDVVEMTREDLYHHVWTTPIHLLAAELGLSDVGLAKTCVADGSSAAWPRLLGAFECGTTSGANSTSTTIGRSSAQMDIQRSPQSSATGGLGRGKSQCAM